MGGLSMDKIGDFFEEVKALWETKDFDKEHGALMFLGADLDNECAFYQGKVKCGVAMLASAMEGNSDLRCVILRAVELFLSDKAKKDDEEE